jgi:hypothetical protein
MAAPLLGAARQLSGNAPALPAHGGAAPLCGFAGDERRLHPFALRDMPILRVAHLCVPDGEKASLTADSDWRPAPRRRLSGAVIGRDVVYEKHPAVLDGVKFGRKRR